MARIGISVTMSTAFRGVSQEFSNVFYYGSVGPQPGEAAAEALLDELVGNMKLFHSVGVQFVRGRVWSAGGTEQQNVMIHEKALSGTGALAANTSWDKERAYLIQWNAGVDSRGNPVKLRKWFHTGGFIASGGTANLPAKLANTEGFSAAERALIVPEVDRVTRLGGAEEWGLVSPTGRERDGGAAVPHQFLEHHQLGDAWR